MYLEDCNVDFAGCEIYKMLMLSQRTRNFLGSMGGTKKFSFFIDVEEKASNKFVTLLTNFYPRDNYLSIFICSSTHSITRTVQNIHLSRICKATNVTLTTIRRLICKKT